MTEFSVEYKNKFESDWQSLAIVNANSPDEAYDKILEYGRIGRVKLTYMYKGFPRNIIFEENNYHISTAQLQDGDMINCYYMDEEEERRGSVFIEDNELEILLDNAKWVDVSQLSKIKILMRNGEKQD